MALRDTPKEQIASWLLDRERAVEHIRAKVASMRSGDDLVHVVALMRWEMVRLGIDTHIAGIGFVDEETQLWRWYNVVDGFRRYGMRPADVLPSNVSIVDDDHVHVSDWIEDADKMPIWQSGQPHTYTRDTHGDGSWFRNQMGFSELTEEFGAWVCERDVQYNTDVPFEHGIVAFAVLEEPQDVHVAIVRELTAALSLGYLRFRDFRQLEAELEKAHELQMGLMPAESPQVPGFDIAGRCIPATHVGGDFYQYFQQNGKLAICMADVTGHAMEAAVPVMMFSGILDTLMGAGDPLEDLFAKLNRSMHRNLDKRTFVCLAMGELDLSLGELQLANGGCPYPYHFCAADGKLRELEVDAYPLGVRSEAEFPVTATDLQSGDYVIFCSDGIVEAANSTEDIFGFEQTAATIRTGCTEGLSATALIDRLIGAVQDFAGDQPQGDDMTCVVIRVEN